jgi:hypothetical protein
MMNYWSSIILMAVLGLAMFGRDWVAVIMLSARYLP